MGHVAIAWAGLPNYAARAIRAGLDAYDGPVAVLGTVPSVATSGMDAALGQKILWVDERSTVTWGALSLEIPTVMVVSGWATPTFNGLAAQVRASGGRVIAMVDNNWRLSPRQWARAALFRLFSRDRYFAFWVPGRAGRRFCQMLGARPERIVEGLYASDPTVFFPGASVAKRDKRILFVGQFVERKGLRVLLRAWRSFRVEHPDWMLTAVGSGPLRQELEQVDGIEVLPFLPPEDVANLMRDARFLVLPSLLEHWGLVVNEACLCGCALLCSQSVGAVQDLATPTNSLLFRPGSVQSCLHALGHAAAADDRWLTAAGEESARLSARFTIANWGLQFRRLVERVSAEKEPTE